MTALVLGIAVAYAALSTTLNLKFSGVTQNALTWNVGFEGTSATATEYGTSATGRSCGTATITQSSVTVAATTLSKPEDKCTYALTIKNAGTIATRLTAITPSEPASTSCTTVSGGTMVCGNITYKLTSDASGENVLTANQTLAAETGTLPVYLVVEYTGSELSASAVTQSNATFDLAFAQA